MIRKRPEAENTMRGPALKNQYWSDFKRYQCPNCGQLHDSAGRTLDERGKIVPNGSVVCPLVDGAPLTAPAFPRSDQASRVAQPKPNRMLGTEEERLNKLTNGLTKR